MTSLTPTLSPLSPFPSPLLLLIALLMSSQCLFAFDPLPASGGSPAETYDSLSHFSSEELLASGRAHFEQRQPGKALACFTVVSERYRDDMTADEAELCIRAMNNCACVYKYFYFDYPRAYEYLSQASDLCERLSPPAPHLSPLTPHLSTLYTFYTAKNSHPSPRVQNDTRRCRTTPSHLPSKRTPCVPRLGTGQSYLNAAVGR